MRARRTLWLIVSVLVVAGVIALALSQTSLLTVTRTETATATVFENVRVTGTCIATSYFYPDTAELYLTTVTRTIGNTTTTYISSSVSYPETTTIGTTAYSVLTYANGTSSFVVTSTSTNYGDEPSYGWSVIVCDYPR